jgi:integrase
VKEPRRVIVPLTREEVHAFLARLRTWRDLSITALMLFCGLRSREVLELTLNDLSFSEGELRVRGKGDKERMVPLPRQVLSLLESYLDVERPRTSTEELFVSLKGPRRGEAMTPAGLRSLFRHHRKAGGVERANPHRFRHTFGSNMARAGISLPALMKLMGHADVHTTMLYVELSARDVWEEFQRIVSKIARERIVPRSDDNDPRD